MKFAYSTVTPHAGVWIETKSTLGPTISPPCHAPRGRVDEKSPVKRPDMDYTRIEKQIWMGYVSSKADTDCRLWGGFTVVGRYLRNIIPAATSEAVSTPLLTATMARAKGMVLPGPLPVIRVSRATTGSPVMSASSTMVSKPG